MRSRPLHGESIYLQCKMLLLSLCGICSRPLHGESIYLLVLMTGRDIISRSSRPLHGESIYLPEKEVCKQWLKQVLVPSTGNLYIYTISQSMITDTRSSRPLHGESIYLHIFQMNRFPVSWFSSPPRGIYISTLKNLYFRM